MSAAAQPAAPVDGRRNILPFAALTAAYSTHAGFFTPFLPLWLKSLGLSIAVISVLTSIQAATRMFAPYAWGALSDRTGERAKLLRWGAMMALIASAGLWFPGGGVAWLAIVMLLMFTQTSGMMPMAEAAVAQVASQGGVFDTKLYGRVRLWGSLGFMAAVLGAGALFERVGMGSFPLFVTLSLVVLVVFAHRLPDVKEAHHSSARRESVPIAPVLAQPMVRWFFASAFFHVLSHMGIYTFFSLYMDSLGYSKTMIGLLWAVSVTVEIGWFFTQSRWMPLLSLPGWLVLCAGVMVLRMGVTASLASTLWVLVVAQAFHAITFAAHHSSCIALVSQHFPGSLRGRGQALYIIIGYGIPGVLGGLLGGQLSQHLGLASVFWGTSAMALLAMACAWRVWHLHRLAGDTAAHPA